jgi:Glycoside hydrolase family 44
VRRGFRRAGALVIGAVVAAACSSGGQQAVQFDELATSVASTDVSSTDVPSTSVASSDVSSTDVSSTSVASTDVSSTEVPSTEVASTSQPAAGGLEVRIDATSPEQEISPLILGVSSTLTAEEMRDGGIQLSSWGGNPSTRYDYMIGHAWNHGADYEFRNTNYGDSGDALRSFLDVSATAGIESRVAVPTLGWVASNDDEATCSFPIQGGGCQPASEVGDCKGDGPIADPRTANTESTPEMVAEWIGGVVAEGRGPRFIAMDNEPELWGATHYDVHPDCPTYEEILDTYLRYATAIREVAPEAELTGPVICCWFDYWHTAPGPADGSDEDFLSWFLRGVRAHDEQYGKRTLDVVDVHYYPQSPVFNEKTDAETNALRLRSTRSLWDPEYVDESWIDTPIEFIPRMKRIIESSYPDTPLFISEWNFGADNSMNGALTIADVLGIYGREGVYAAAYWRNPEVGSPGYLAFKMHGNYDGQGSRFAGRVVATESPDPDRLSVFGALDETAGVLRLMLITKDPESPMSVDLHIDGFTPASSARRFTYGPDHPTEIVTDSYTAADAVTLPASSITVVEFKAGS